MTKSPWRFDRDRFAFALDVVRGERGLSWRQVADQSGVSASTLTRIQQDKSPDMDTFAALCGWGRLSSGEFIVETKAP
ncbi:MAG: helix-turn-helix transcriptional regulator [Pseudomonadota bacterium]